MYVLTILFLYQAEGSVAETRYGTRDLTGYEFGLLQLHQEKNFRTYNKYIRIRYLRSSFNLPN